MLVKLCGLRREEDIAYVNEFLPDYVGFVFAPSRRQVTAEQAATLRAGLTPSIRAAGVFVNESIAVLIDTLQRARLDVIQLHGDEGEGYIRSLHAALDRAGQKPEVWKAIRVRNTDSIQEAEGLAVDRLLLDAFHQEAYGGTGKAADWALIAQNRPSKPFFLAGGLTPLNLLEAVEQTKPDGVDISSGIETDGVKDREQIEAVMKLVRGLESEAGGTTEK